MASSAQHCGVELQERTEWRGAYTKPDGTLVPARIENVGWVAKAQTVAAIDAATRRMEPSLTPPGRDQIEAWLAELSVITARRRDDAGTEDLRLQAYANRLRDYPADVAHEALLVHRWHFFPSWEELAQVCDRLFEPRRQMMAAMESEREKAAEREARARALPDETTITLTPEEREALAAEAAERKAEAVAFVGDIVAKLRERQESQAAAEAQRRADLAAGYRRGEE